MDIFSLEAKMTADFSVLMAVVDFLPVLFYFLASSLVARDLYNKVSRTSYSLLAAGSIICFLGGAFKALWKLLFVFGHNFPLLYAAFFPMQAPGFGLYFIGLIMALVQTKKKTPKLTSKEENGDSLKAVTATAVTTNLNFIMIQTIGSVGSLVCLAIFAGRMKKPSAIVCFVLSIILLFTMGGLGVVIDSSLGWANWLEQGVNTLAQIIFFIGVLILHKNGFGEKEISK